MMQFRKFFFVLVVLAFGLTISHPVFATPRDAAPVLGLNAAGVVRDQYIVVFNDNRPFAEKIR